MQASGEEIDLADASRSKAQMCDEPLERGVFSQIGTPRNAVEPQPPPGPGSLTRRPGGPSQRAPWNLAAVRGSRHQQ